MFILFHLLFWNILLYFVVCPFIWIPYLHFLLICFRDEDEQDDFEERINLKLAEQEEDLDRVKEESRKRRQAILEKFRNQQSLQKNETRLEDVEKGVF